MFEERLRLFAQLALVAAVTVLSVSQLSLVSLTDDVRKTRTEQLIDNGLNGGLLEVRPAHGQPEPLDQPLQGTPRSTDQRAAGDIQQPLTNDVQKQNDQNLQPNVGTDGLPEDFDF